MLQPKGFNGRKIYGIVKVHNWIYFKCKSNKCDKIFRYKAQIRINNYLTKVKRVNKIIYNKKINSFKEIKN